VLKESYEYMVKANHVTSANQKTDSFHTLHDLETYLDKKVIWLFITAMRYTQRRHNFK